MAQMLVRTVIKLGSGQVYGLSLSSPVCAGIAGTDAALIMINGRFNRLDPKSVLSGPPIDTSSAPQLRGPVEPSHTLRRAMTNRPDFLWVFHQTGVDEGSAGSRSEAGP